MQLRDCPCDTLVKNVTAFCPCPKSCLKAKLQSYGLIALAEDILKQRIIDCAMWLLVAGLMQFCNGKKQSEQRKLKTVIQGNQKVKWN